MLFFYNKIFEWGFVIQKNIVEQFHNFMVALKEKIPVINSQITVILYNNILCILLYFFVIAWERRTPNM